LNVAALDAAFIAAVKAILSAVGVSGTLTRIVTSYEAEDDEEHEADPVTYTALSSPPMRYKKKEVDGESILSTDFKVYVSPEMTDSDGATATVEPDKRYDRLTLNGVSYAIQDLDSLWSGDQVAAYVLQLRA
jgi:hypothetical protein